MFILVHKNDRKTFVNTPKIIVTKAVTYYREVTIQYRHAIEMVKSICVLSTVIDRVGGEYWVHHRQGCACRGWLPLLASGLTCLMPDKFNLIHFQCNCPWSQSRHASMGIYLLIVIWCKWLSLGLGSILQLMFGGDFWPNF